MRFEEELKKRDLSAFFLDATTNVVKTRLIGAQRSDIDDVVQDVRVQTLRVLDDLIRTRIDSGERETDAIDAVLTRRCIASVASRRAKQFCRNLRKSTFKAFYDEESFVPSTEIRFNDVRLREAASSLTSLQRAVFNLIADGYSASEIAQKTKLSRGVVRQILREIRSALEKKGFGANNGK